MIKIINIFRWIGVAVLPVLVALLLAIIVNFILRYVFFAVFWRLSPAIYCAQFLSNCLFGAIIPIVAGIIAPCGKKIAAIVVTSVVGCLSIVSTLLLFAEGSYFMMLGNIISVLVAISTTVYIYKLVNKRDRYLSNDIIDSDQPNDDSLRDKITTVTIATTGIIFGLLLLLIKLIMWLVGLAILGFIVHWGWSIIGNGFWWSALGIVIFVAAAPSLYGVGFQMIMLCVMSVPILCNAIFGDN